MNHPNRSKRRWQPMDWERFAEERDLTGWMYPDKEFRVPEPTHWSGP